MQMHNSYTSQSEAPQQACPQATVTGTASLSPQLPFDRGGLSSGGLISSAQDMTRYLSLYLNDGQGGGTALVSPAGAAELQRSLPVWTASPTRWGGT
jgi:CubicO group peptidase (beta-lactamase class C family)